MTAEHNCNLRSTLPVSSSSPLKKRPKQRQLKKLGQKEQIPSQPEYRPEAQKAMASPLTHETSNKRWGATCAQKSYVPLPGPWACQALPSQITYTPLQLPPLRERINGLIFWKKHDRENLRVVLLQILHESYREQYVFPGRARYQRLSFLDTYWLM